MERIADDYNDNKIENYRKYVKEHIIQECFKGKYSTTFGYLPDEIIMELKELGYIVYPNSVKVIW